MAAAEYRVGIDWDGDGTTTGVGEDVTGRVLGHGGVSISYGRDQARSLAPMGIGEASLVLDNSSRDYSPEHAGSPLAGLVGPGRAVAITATLAGTEHTLYTGHLDDYDVLPDLAEQRVRLSCLDPLARLKGQRVSTGLYQGIRTGDAVGLVLDAVGWPSGLRTLDPGATVIPWWWLSDQDAYEALAALVDSEGPTAMMSVGADGHIVFYDRHHRLFAAASTAVQATWRGEGVEPLLSPPIRIEHGWRDIVNTVSFPVGLRQPGGELAQVWRAPGQITVADGQTITLTVVGSEPFFAAVTPEAGVDYTTLSGAVTVTLGRTSGQATTIAVTAAGGPAIVTDLQLRAIPVPVQATVQVTAEETVSIGTYGRRDWPSSRAPVWAGVHDAAAIADLILAQRATRLPVLTVTMVGANDARQAQQLGRDLGDLVHITDPVSGVDADFHVERIEHTITGPGAEHITRFGCEQVPAAIDNVFRFDVAGHGFDDGVFGGIGRDDPDNVFRFDVAGHGFDDGVFAT